MIDQDYQIFWTYSGEILGAAAHASYQPYEGPNSIKLQKINLKEQILSWLQAKPTNFVTLSKTTLMTTSYV